MTLSAFLIGIAVGARNAAQACHRFAPAEAMRKAATELIWANIFGAAFLPLLAQVAWIGPGVIGIGIIVIYLIARQWGALLPYLSQFGISADSRAGMQTAILYFANIVGCATGAVLTGFFLSNWLGLKSMAVFLLAGGTFCAVLLIAALHAPLGERMRRGGIALAILIAGAVANPVIASRVLENLQSKGVADHDFAHVVENRSGIITVNTDGTVYGNGMYDGRFNIDLKTDVNGIIRPYALSLFHPAPRDVLMIGLSSGSWAQVIASNPEVASLTIVEINRGYLELIKAQPEVQSILAQPEGPHHRRMTAAAGSAITPKCASTRSSRTRPGIFAPTAPTCSRWSFSRLSSSTSIPAACSSTTRPTPAGCSGRLARVPLRRPLRQSRGGFANADRLGFFAVADDFGELQDRRQTRIRSQPCRRSRPDRFDHDPVRPRRPHDRGMPGNTGGDKRQDAHHG